MSYKIVMDSCCDMPPEYHKDPRFEFVPLALEVGDYHIIDDETFDQAEFLRHVAESEECPRSACPSPDRFMRAYETDADRVYCVTLTSRLSGSYNSALLAVDLYHEEHGDKDIFVVDSRSSCSGEAQMVFKIMDLEEQGLPFDEICKEMEKFRDNMLTYFVLDNLETLRKNGRLTGMKALVATTLNIKPICAGEEGVIVQKGQGIGIRKALLRMTDLFIKELKDSEEKRLIIAHCNCYERAMLVRDLIEAKAHFKETIVVDTAGCGSMYCNDGGIVVTA
ncbi:DegV family protein [Butyrivibrio sp. MC2013]|uniref:DegV family protein n=1 Tax=Butyrivibrio sp. MC2013 TaxID=1280686 RepID=UPI0004020757|nr:DegV family protein [Butyrivibrio sp. MC2013]